MAFTCPRRRLPAHHPARKKSPLRECPEALSTRAPGANWVMRDELDLNLSFYYTGSGLQRLPERRRFGGIRALVRLRACLRKALLGKPSYHQVDHRHPDPRLTGAGMELVIFTQAATPIQPGKGAFDNPAMRQELPARGLHLPFHNPQIPAALLPGPLHQLARIAAIRPDPEQAGPDLGGPRQHEFRAVPILQSGLVDHHGEHQAQGVYEEVALATVDLLVFVAADRGLGPPFWWGSPPF